MSKIQEIYIDNKWYYYWDTYTTWERAYEEAMRLKKKDKVKYFILPTIEGALLPVQNFHLYVLRRVQSE